MTGEAPFVFGLSLLGVTVWEGGGGVAVVFVETGRSVMGLDPFVVVVLLEFMLTVFGSADTLDVGVAETVADLR